MKRRLLPLLLVLGLLCALFPAAWAEEETAEPVTALCVARPGESVPLDVKELQQLCLQATKHELKSVCFSPLPAGVGTLACKGEKVVSHEPYYMYEHPLLSQIRFTPHVYLSTRFTGQAQLSFTMTSEEGETVPGTLILYVPESEEEEPSPMDEAVTCKAGAPISLTDILPEEIYYKSRSASGGYTSISSIGDGWFCVGAGDLTSAAFQLPSSDQGSLWLDYGWSEARKVLPEEVLYSDREPNFYNVTFVPAGKEDVTVRLRYTASCEKKKSVPGALTLTLVGERTPPPSDPKPVVVQPNPAAVSTCTAQVGLANALYKSCASRKQGDLKTVAFDTLPTAAEGTIRSVDTPISVGMAYAYNSLSFLPGEAFQGDVTLRYVGVDSMNLSFSGTLTLELDYPSAGRFQDLTGWEWATYAAQFLDMKKAVPYQKSEPFFRPGASATRMELVYALVQVAYPNAEQVSAPDFFDLPDDAELSGAAALAIAHGLLQGDGEKQLFLDAQVTRQDALVMLHRALTDLGQDLPPAADLSSFSDAGELSPYARESAAVLCAKGILQGNGSGQLSPLSPITRAEMACLLYRAFS